MANEERILRPTAASAMAPESLRRADDVGARVDLSRLEGGASEPRVGLNLRVDRDILEYFRSSGPGHRQRIHAVLRAHVDRMKKP